jgi:hypothetical protein
MASTAAPGHDSLLRMKHLVASLLCALALTAQAAAPAVSTDEDLPEGVVYAPADQENMESARKRLLAALSSGPEDLARLMGLGEKDAKTLVGPYFGIEIDADHLKGRAFLPRGKYHFPVPGEAGLIVESFSAADAAQKRFLAHYVLLAADFHGEFAIRRPTFDELALIWGWVSWDLDDPLLIVESARDKYVFDFDPRTGLITWIERLTSPCFTGLQDGKKVLDCHCSRIARDGRKWQIQFEKLQSCPAPAINLVGFASSKETSALAPAYLPTNDKDARTDAMLARVFAKSHAITVIPTELPGYKGPGKPYGGGAPITPRDEKGEPIHGYVLFGSVLNADGQVGPTRILISTDDRLSSEILRATGEWRVEPATRDGKPIAVIFWQEWPF